MLLSETQYCMLWQNDNISVRLEDFSKSLIFREEVESKTKSLRLNKDKDNNVSGAEHAVH